MSADGRCSSEMGWERNLAYSACARSWTDGFTTNMTSMILETEKTFQVAYLLEFFFRFFYIIIYPDRGC